ncbi:hypothetical protein [uncultured Clostridium sp.]|uniref:hypothetical protein n=1 Tax=uncultured Clostridium sp. TaxID=59620 RepID=UPI0028E8599B|nr:hypothetical protein [uncultured Clostridium sp.]
MSNIDGLAKYNEIAYKNCPLSNPKSLSIVTRRRNKAANNEIIEIINNNKDLLLKYIRNITGIYFSYKKFEILLSEFFNMEGYDYESINKFNLPYAFLYQQRKINIFGQRIMLGTEHNQMLETAIKEQSEYYELINKNQISVKAGMPFVELNIALFNHRIVKKGKKVQKQTIDLVVSEDVIKEGTSHEILRQTIDIDTASFVSEIIDSHDTV